MLSIDVANYLIDKWGDKIVLTNLKLNKLVYFTQADSLRLTGSPIFEDEIQAWQYGPVEPMVYRNFSAHGRNRITEPTSHPDVSQKNADIIDGVAKELGNLSAFDLVNLSHNPNGAWASVYSQGSNKVISLKDIVDSCDARNDRNRVITFSKATEDAFRSMPNALQLLENS